jgi:hypothetical protein
MKNVLVPTDFSIESLELINKTAKSIADKLNIYLFHAYEIPAGNDKTTNKKNNLITEQLRQRCRRIKASNKNICNISVKIMQGASHTLFNNFTNNHKIDVLVMPHKYVYIPPTAESVSPIKLFRKSTIEKLSNFREVDFRQNN